MTGRRPLRGGGGDPWRGGRPARPDDADRGEVELEELSVQSVARRAKPRVTSSAALAAVALVGLLGAGFGALGGRPEGSTAPTTTSAASGGVAAAPTPQLAPTAPVRTPAMTPFRTCRPLDDAAPEILLRVDGVATAGTVQAETPAPNPTPGPADQHVEIPADATTEIWIGGDVCASAWHISLSTDAGGRLLPLELQPNPELDPLVASQNRFNVPLVRYRLEPGGLQLRAALEFPGLELVASWPIRYLPFEWPQPRLLIAGEDRYFPTVQGCDIGITFRSGFEERHECAGDLGQPLPPRIELEPGQLLGLIFSDWSVTQSTATCGRVSNLEFEALRSGCWDEPQDGLAFAAPPPGDLVIAIEACAVDGTGFESNRICGTWYVRVDTR